MINIIKKASNSNKPYTKRDFITSLELKFNNSAKKNVGLYNLLKKNRSIGFSLLEKIKVLSNTKWQDIEENIISIRASRHKGKVYVKFPILINEDLGCIIGHILGDGSIDKKYMQLSFSNKCIDLTREFSNIMRNIFGIEPRIWLQKPGNFIDRKTNWVKRVNSLEEVTDDLQVNLFYPSICGIILNSIFNDFAIGKQKKLTEKILSASDEFKIGLIRAFLMMKVTLIQTVEE